MRLIYLLAAVVLTTAACESKPKVSALQMKRALNTNVYAFNKALTGFDFGEAKTYVAPAADPKLDALAEEMKRGDFNLLMTDELPQIDYLKGEAKVPVRLLKGENAPAGQPKPMASQVAIRNFLWKFNNGSWQWYGTSPQ